MFKTVCFLILFYFASICVGAEDWSLLPGKTIDDEAVKIALNDLIDCASQYEIICKIKDKVKKGNRIYIGHPDRDDHVKILAEKYDLALNDILNPQGFQILSFKDNDNKIILICGATVTGNVNGIYWLWDRLRITKTIPQINSIRIPDLDIRFVSGNSKEEIRQALRYGATWVYGGPSVNHLVPWNDDELATQNEQNCLKVKELADYAHSLHLKFFVFEDEFSYHPSLFKEFNATLSPADPAFWEAVQAKYRRLFQALPEIDGIRLRTGESTRIGGAFKPYDVMHEGENCNWGLEKRYRTFVKKMYDVVVGEFDKIYFQRTWVTSHHEQHSVAEVYKNIFTDEIPVKNLYLSPYLSTTDRFFHQPYNPTFNQTPHNMIVLLSTLDYHSRAGVNTFPSFPGLYFQCGLKTIMMPKNHVLKGVDFGMADPSDWNTRGVTAYTVWRLSWEHDADIKEIASDFASIHFGPEAADQIAELYQLSPNAYKYGIYIEPAAYGDFSSLPHLRLTTFPAKGFPWLDNGKKHIGFLYRLYLRCLPWQQETLMYLDHGLEIAGDMQKRFQNVKPLLQKNEKSIELEQSIDLTKMLIQTNIFYIKTFFAYFDYRNDPSLDNRIHLLKTSSALMNSMRDFSNTPGCVYRLDGMNQLLNNVDQAVEDINKAEQMLANAPDEDEIKQIILDQQQKHAQLFQNRKNEMVHLLHWRGRVDGQDMLHISKDKLKVEHLRYDHIADMSFEFFNPLPDEPVSVIIVDKMSRSYKPFILTQPSSKNSYKATVFLSDFPCHGYSWWEFDLYYIRQEPKVIGLDVPWN